MDTSVSVCNQMAMGARSFRTICDAPRRLRLLEEPEGSSSLAPVAHEIVFRVLARAVGPLPASAVTRGEGHDQRQSETGLVYEIAP